MVKKTKTAKAKKPLPDTWEPKYDDYGRQKQPPRGHKVGIYWGDLLRLEWALRGILKELQTAKALPCDDDCPDYEIGLIPYWEAREMVEELETAIASLRKTGKLPPPPPPEPPEVKEARQREIDAEIPF